MLPDDINIEFVSTSHRSAKISYMIEMFCADVKLYTRGISVQPRHVGVDFLFALINAILSSFNKCTLASYLRISFGILKQERSADDLV